MHVDVLDGPYIFRRVISFGIIICVCSRLLVRQFFGVKCIIFVISQHHTWYSNSVGKRLSLAIFSRAEVKKDDEAGSLPPFLPHSWAIPPPQPSSPSALVPFLAPPEKHPQKMEELDGGGGAPPYGKVIASSGLEFYVIKIDLFFKSTPW